MGLLEVLLLKHLRFGIFTFTSFIALLLGVITWATLFPSQSANREPASISRRSAILVEKGFSTDLNNQAMSEFGLHMMDVDCRWGKKHEPVKITGKSLRLRTKGCDLKRIWNFRNGFEASLFETSEGHFTSDYISLAEGENQLRLEGQNAKGDPILVEFTILYQ